MQSRSKRNELLKGGAYDGRYRQRVVIDKKKKHSKNWARKNKNKQYENKTNNAT